MITEFPSLKRVIIRCWAEISQDLVDAAINEWPRRVAAVVQAAHQGDLHC